MAIARAFFRLGCPVGCVCYAHSLRKVVETTPQAARYVLRMAEHRHPAVRKEEAATLVSRSWVKGFGLRFLMMMRSEPNHRVRSYLLSWGQ